MVTIGKVIVKSPVRTTIADPNFKPKPNVALTELTDTNITNLTDGSVISYDATQEKFVVAPVNQSNLDITNINGGAF